MTRIVVGLTFVLAALCTGIATQASFDAQKQSEPPHRERAAAPVYVGLPGDMPDVWAAYELVLGALEAQRLEEERLAVEAAVAIETERAAEEARARQARPRVPASVSNAGGDCARIAAEFGLPVAVIIAESRCNPNAYNPSGCGGRGCIGAAQLDAGHFAPVSPWNRNVAGTCADLDPNSYTDQRTCAARLPRGAW